MHRRVVWHIARHVAQAGALVVATAANAHLMPPGQGAVRIEADSVFAVVSIPVSALSGFDDDGDKRMTLAEMNRHRDSLLAQSATLLDFRSGGERPALVFQDLLIPHLHDPAAPPSTDQVVAMQRWRWNAPISSLRLHASIFASHEAPLALRINDGKRSEAVTLTPGYPEHRFFESAWLRNARFRVLGIALWQWGAAVVTAGFALLLARRSTPWSRLRRPAHYNRGS